MDYLDYHALLALDIDADTARRLLAASPLTGHDGRPVIEAERLPELFAALADLQIIRLENARPAATPNQAKKGLLHGS